ncbi:hypothetical protein HPB52_007085 [Rhipicephalus sanguineus]|uniref:Peptidase M13 N-terminal domain-containing protein n=1 Tax=Rhipicephalus sanguineus TaxID=34632 RepID=A0A9D4PGH1_RHISA|nr:hypothetical protein HPB52_007085 [Rhipicephalus sanguineus]
MDVLTSILWSGTTWIPVRKEPLRDITMRRAKTCLRTAACLLKKVPYKISRGLLKQRRHCTCCAGIDVVVILLSCLPFRSKLISRAFSAAGIARPGDRHVTASGRTGLLESILTPVAFSERPSEVFFLHGIIIGITPNAIGTCGGPRAARFTKKNPPLSNPGLKPDVDMAAPAAPAGSSAAKKVKSPIPEEKSTKKRAEAIKSPKRPTSPKREADKAYRRKVFIAVATLVIAAGAFLFYLTLWTTITPAHKDNYACNTPICEQVMKQLSEYADSAINPCDDFYSHVCGHWLRKAESSTFMSDAKKQFIARRHELLISPFNSSDPNSDVFETARAFYRSCLDMFEAPVVIKTALRELYTRVLKDIAETTFMNKVVDELIQLDRMWDARVAMKGAPDFPKRVADLSCGPFTADVWGASFAEHGARSDTDVEAIHFGLTCSFMEAVFVNASAQARPLYLLALMAAQALTLDFQLAGSPRSRELLMDVCQNGALHLFGEMWLHAMSMSLSLKRPSVQDIKNFTNFGRRLQRVVLERQWMSQEDRAKSADRVGSYQVFVFPDSAMSTQQLECSRFGQGDKSLSRLVLSNTFIKNIVYIYKVELSPSCAENQKTAIPTSTQEAMLGTDIAIDILKRTVIVPQFLGAEPLFYVGDVEKFINIATVTTLVSGLGAQLASRRYAHVPVIGMNDSGQKPWSDETLGKYNNLSHCLAKVYKLPGKPLSDIATDAVFSLMDGIEVAKNTKSEFDGENVEENPRRQLATDALFFKRACLTLCASHTDDSDINEVIFGTAYAACNYGVGRLEQFHRAFECTEKHRMRAILQCFDPYRAKDTDVA